MRLSTDQRINRLRPYLVRGAIVVGSFMLLVVGVPLVITPREQSPPSRVARCEIRHASQYYFELQLEDGRTITLTSQELPGWRICLSEGTLVEKRRGERGWRINGSYVAEDQRTLYPAIVLTALGGLLFLSGLAFVAVRHVRQR